MKKLYLVDVSSMYFRAFYAVRPLSNPQGMPTNALYGFMSMAVKLLKEIQPDYIAFCFDRKEPSFRKDIYPDYKANRTEMPEDLVPQVPYVRKISEALGVPCFDLEKYEADDLIGTLTVFGRKNGLEVVIVSGDKDFAQLVDPFVTMYDTMKDVRYGVEGVAEKWGVQPEQVMDYLALTGDSSDNIPGVSGIGPKGAQKLLAEYKTLNGIYSHIDEIKNAKLKEKLIADKKNAFLSRELVEIKKDVPINVGLKDLTLKPVSETQMKVLLEELDFKSFERKIFGSQNANHNNVNPRAASSSLTSSSTTSASKNNDTTLSQDVSEYSGETQKNDSATSGAEYSSVQMGFEFQATEEQEAEFADIISQIKTGDDIWGHRSDRGLIIGVGQKAYIARDFSPKMAKLLEEKQVRWKGFGLKSFWHDLGLQRPLIAWDSAVAAYVVRAGEVKSFAETYKTHTSMSLPDLPSPAALLKAHLQLEEILLAKMTKQNGLQIYQKLDLPLEPVLYRMEKKGVCLNAQKLNEQSADAEKEIARIESEIFEETGEKFNLTSPKQLSEVLFNKLKMPVIRKTKTGVSTDYDVLIKLSKDFPVCLKIIEYREITKLKSTYLDALPQMVNPETGRIHSHFHQTVTTTGRLSSTNPNLQNIPIRTERGSRVRQAFTVESGYTMVSADYSQIELRILAHISNDKGLLSAFEKDLDIHSATAAEVFEIPLQEVTSEHRRVAKAVNFGIAYGMTPYGLSENLNIPVEEASGIIKRYFSRFSGIRDYMNDSVEFAKKHGYVETIMGRRRYIDELKSTNTNVRKFGERAAINAPMQGTAADIVKKAMLDIDNAIPDKMILQVHDELVFEFSNSEYIDRAKQVQGLMESSYPLKVRLKVNVASGNDWDSAH